MLNLDGKVVSCVKKQAKDLEKNWKNKELEKLCLQVYCLKNMLQNS